MSSIFLFYSSMHYSQQPTGETPMRREAGAFVWGRKRQGPSFNFRVSLGQDSQLNSKSLPHRCTYLLHALPRSTCRQTELFPPKDNAAPTGLSKHGLLAFLSCLCACARTHTHTHTHTRHCRADFKATPLRAVKSWSPVPEDKLRGQSLKADVWWCSVGTSLPGSESDRQAPWHWASLPHLLLGGSLLRLVNSETTAW